VKGRVYAIQNPTTRRGGEVVPAFDFSSASKYGEGPVVILLDNARGILTPDVLIKNLRDLLDSVDFDPVYDYIIPVGDYSICFLLGMVLGQSGFARILRWIPEAQSYQPLTLDIRR